MDRALYSAYDGPLYQVKRASDGTTATIGLLSAGGYVNAAEQDSFCSGTTCTITEIYDQSPEGNNLAVEGQPEMAGPASRPWPTRRRSRSTATRHTAWTSPRGPATETTTPRGSRPATNNDDNGAGHMDDFVTAMLSNNGQNTFELQGGNAQSGSLTTYWDGSLPSGYKPMHQEGAIVLGTGGDNSQSDVGSFFEGVMTSGFPSASTDAAVQASIVSAGSASPAGPSAAGPAVVHAGYSSVYTVDDPEPVRELRHPAGGGLARPVGGQPVNIRESARRRRSPPD